MEDLEKKRKTKENEDELSELDAPEDQFRDEKFVESPKKKTTIIMNDYLRSYTREKLAEQQNALK